MKLLVGKNKLVRLMNRAKNMSGTRLCARLSTSQSGLKPEVAEHGVACQPLPGRKASESFWQAN